MPVSPRQSLFTVRLQKNSPCSCRGCFGLYPPVPGDMASQPHGPCGCDFSVRLHPGSTGHHGLTRGTGRIRLSFCIFPDHDSGINHDQQFRDRHGKAQGRRPAEGGKYQNQNATDDKPSCHRHDKCRSRFHDRLKIVGEKILNGSRRNDGA